MGFRFLKLLFNPLDRGNTNTKGQFISECLKSYKITTKQL